MKYLVTGLGNIGQEYENTRHNIGFRVLDAFAKASNILFTDGRYGATCACRLKNRELLLLKPSTYMNSSGLAVRYWMNKDNIPLENVLIVVDDISLPFGAIRLKGNGSSGGHNGLKSIQELIGENYARLKFGISGNFERGQQIHYVLGAFSDDEEQKLPARIEVAVEAVKSFCLAGLQLTMTQFNNK